MKIEQHNFSLAGFLWNHAYESTNCMWKYVGQCMTCCAYPTNSIFHLCDSKFHTLLLTPWEDAPLLHHCIICTFKLKKQLVLLPPHLHPGLLFICLSIYSSYSFTHFLINLLFTNLHYILLSPYFFFVKIHSIFKKWLWAWKDTNFQSLGLTITNRMLGC